jgi:iron complex transport system substrate-binding protein
MRAGRFGRLCLPGLVAVLLLAACGGGGTKQTAQATAVGPQATQIAAAASPTAAQESRTFTDDNGKTLTIPQPPKRVVALSPSVVEILYAVGAPPVARVSSALYPEEAKALPAVGSSYQPSIEQIAAQQPDLIIADQQIQRPDVIAELEKVAPVFAMRVLTVDDLLKGLRTAGRIMGKAEQGERAAQAIADKFAAVQAKLPAQRPTVFIMVGTADAFFAAKPTSFVGDVVQRLGARNLVTEGPDTAGFPGFTTYSLERLVQLDPDVILVATAAPPNAPRASQVLAANPAWANLRAVKSGRVYEIDPVTLVQSAGPRVAQQIDELARYLYPGVFAATTR